MEGSAPSSPLMSSGGMVGLRERGSTLTIGDKREKAPVRRKAKAKVGGDELEVLDGYKSDEALPSSPREGGEQSGAGPEVGSPRYETNNTTQNNGNQERGESEGITDAEKELRRKAEEIRRVAEWRGRGGRRGSGARPRSGCKTPTGGSGIYERPPHAGIIDGSGERKNTTEVNASSEDNKDEEGHLRLLLDEIDKQDRPADSRAESLRMLGPQALKTLVRGGGQRGSILVLDEASADLHQILQEQHEAMLAAEKQEAERKRREEKRSKDEEDMKGKGEVLYMRKQIDELIAANLALTRELQARASAAEAMQLQLTQAEAKRQEEALLREAMERKLTTKLAEIEAHAEKKLHTLLASLKSQ